MDLTSLETHRVVGLASLFKRAEPHISCEISQHMDTQELCTWARDQSEGLVVFFLWLEMLNVQSTCGLGRSRLWW
jgi:hypothetical protein